MPSPSRKLSLEDLATARRLYEVDGLSHRAIAARFGVAHATIGALLRAAGATSRPVGNPNFRSQAPPPRPAVEIAPDARGRLRIPWRTPEERRLRRWTAAELQAIDVELRAGRVQRVRHRGSGNPRWHPGASFEFIVALKRLKAAA
jgi:transposase